MLDAETRSLGSVVFVLAFAVAALAQEGGALPPVPTPTDVKPGSITCDECPYPYPSKYLDISVYDAGRAHRLHGRRAAGHAPTATPSLLLHGNNFGGFYFKAIIDGADRRKASASSSPTRSATADRRSRSRRTTSTRRRATPS